jgi:indole-3-acetate monooxygenase
VAAAAGSRFVDAARDLAPQILACGAEIERSRRIPQPLIDAMSESGLFRLWVPRSFGGAEVDPITLVTVVEEISRADGAAGWCLAIGGEYGVFGGYLPAEAAREIYGDENARTAGAFRPAGEATVVDGGYRVTGRWPLGSGCQHSTWIVGGCRVLEGGQPRLAADGAPLARILFFPAADCEIIDTWDSIGLRGTGSHDYAVRDAFVPAARSFSFREPPAEAGPLYAIPTAALLATVLAAVPLGIARHAIEIIRELAKTKIASRSRRGLSEDATMQTNLGVAEAVLGSARGYLYDTLDDVWQSAVAGKAFGVEERARLWLAATHAATAAKQATELMFVAGSSASPYARNGIERCVRDIHAASQHVGLAPPNYQMVGQALLGLDMRASLLLSVDDRGA